MGDNSKIHWLDGGDDIRPATWNPVMGCSRVGVGCDKCYALNMINRYAGRKGWPEAPGKVTYFQERIEQPSRWTKPRRIFVCSMGDLFHPDVPWLVIHNVYNEILDNPRHTFIILTKRDRRMLDFILYRMKDIPNNIWHGVSVTRKEDVSRIGSLMHLNVNRFVSFEPLIGKEIFNPYLCGCGLVIIGGESGHGAREINLDLAQHLVEVAKDQGVKVFFKQMGSAWAKRNRSKTIKGDDPEEWPEWARRRDLPW